MNENIIQFCLWCRTVQEVEAETCPNCGRAEYIRPRHRFTVGEFATTGDARCKASVSGIHQAHQWAKLAEQKTGACIEVVHEADGGAHCTCPTEEDYQAVTAWANGPH